MQVDDRVGRLRVELARVRAGEAEHVAGEVDGHHLHAEAQPEARDAVARGRSRRRRSCPRPPRSPKPPGMTMPSRSRRRPAASSPSTSSAWIQSISTSAPWWKPPCFKRLDHREVGVVQAHVLADEPDAHRLRPRPRPGRPGPPTADRSGSVSPSREVSADHGVEALVVQHERDLVEVAGVGAVDDRVDGHVAQVGDLALQPVGERRARCGTRWRRAGCLALRSSVTECCVGLVFCSPDGPMNGTSVTCT